MRSPLLRAAGPAAAAVLAAASILSVAPTPAAADPGGADTSFGGGDGWSTTDIGDLVTVDAMARTSDGRLLVGGSFDVSGSPQAYIARFAADGTLDTGFGSGGVVTGWTVSFSNPTTQRVAALAVDTSGRVLATGQHNSFGAYVAAFNANGSLDSGFAGDGVAEIGTTVPRSIAVEGTGDIVLGADSYDSFSNSWGWGRLRLSAAGSTVDNSTGPLGRFDASDATTGGMVPMAGGYWVAAGTLAGAPNDLQLRRFGSDLTVDGSWGTGGAIAIDLGAAVTVEDAAVDADGNLIVVGTLGADGFVLRADADGSPDPTFGPAGIATIDTGASEHLRAVALDPDGRIYAVGDTAGGEAFAARLSTAGVIDTTFGISGFAGLTGVSPAGATGVVVSGDGSIRTAGVGQVSGDSQVLLTGILGGAVVPGPCDGSHGLTAQVCRLYRATLLRDPDADGLAYWRQVRAGGASLTTVAAALVASPEFISRYGSLDDAAFVSLVYSNVLSRQPDGPGLAYWVARLGAGMSRGALMTGFSESAEFADATSLGPVQSPAEGSITRLYQAFFNRDPDGPGQAYWVARLAAGTPLEGTADAFVTSAEFVNAYGTLSDSAFVTQVYQNVLGRSADPDGRIYWEGRLAGGLTRGAMMTGFSESPEYRLLTDTV